MRFLKAAFLCAVLSACVVDRAYYQYSGEPKMSQDEAVLAVRDGDGVFIKYLDGKELGNPFTTLNGGWSAVRELHLLPGVHEISGPFGANWYNVSYDFSAGKQYQLVPKIAGYKFRVDVIENN